GAQDREGDRRGSQPVRRGRAAQAHAAGISGGASPAPSGTTPADRVAPALAFGRNLRHSCAPLDAGRARAKGRSPGGEPRTQKSGYWVMRVTVERAALLKALGHVHRVVEKRNTIPILSNVLLRAEEGSLRLRATDLDIEV